MNKARHHRIDYIEFTVTDLERAKQFYGEVFQWHFTDYGPEYVGIRAAPDDELEMGGFCLGTPHSKPTGAPLVVLYSDELETTLNAVKTAGGTISTEPFSFPGGRRFHFTDPCGNELAVWQTVE